MLDWLLEIGIEFIGLHYSTGLRGAGSGWSGWGVLLKRGKKGNWKGEVKGIEKEKEVSERRKEGQNGVAEELVTWQEEQPICRWPNFEPRSSFCTNTYFFSYSSEPQIYLTTFLGSLSRWGIDCVFTWRSAFPFPFRLLASPSSKPRPPPILQIAA